MMHDEAYVRTLYTTSCRYSFKSFSKSQFPKFRIRISILVAVALQLTSPFNTLCIKTCHASVHVIVQVAKRLGHRVLGWRKVPTNNADLGQGALDTEPVIEQVFVLANPDSKLNFEQQVCHHFYTRFRTRPLDRVPRQAAVFAKPYDYGRVPKRRGESG